MIVIKPANCYNQQFHIRTLSPEKLLYKQERREKNQTSHCKGQRGYAQLIMIDSVIPDRIFISLL